MPERTGCLSTQLTNGHISSRYVSPDAVDKDAIIAELKQRLPAHFVPSLIVPLAEMPLSPAGKVRRSTARQVWIMYLSRFPESLTLLWS